MGTWGAGVSSCPRPSSVTTPTGGASAVAGDGQAVRLAPLARENCPECGHAAAPVPGARDPAGGVDSGRARHAAETPGPSPQGGGAATSCVLGRAGGGASGSREFHPSTVGDNSPPRWGEMRRPAWRWRGLGGGVLAPRWWSRDVAVKPGWFPPRKFQRHDGGGETLIPSTQGISGLRATRRDDRTSRPILGAGEGAPTTQSTKSLAACQFPSLATSTSFRATARRSSAVTAPYRAFCTRCRCRANPACCLGRSGPGP